MEEVNREHHPLRFFADIFPVRFGDDVVDLPEKTPHISKWDIFLLISSILMHIVDMLFDYNIAIRYLLNGKITYFIWTLCLVVIPSLINVIVSKRMQHQDKEINSSSNIEGYKATHLIIKSKICFVIAVILQLAPVLHYYDTLKYALKSYKCGKSGDRTAEKRYYLKMLKEDQDVALLRIFECFLEAAPQQILQLSLILKHHHDINLEFVHQVATIVSSFISMGWAMASYHRSIRLAQQDKSHIGTMGYILQFLWHICITASRILSISIIASIWPLFTIICCIIHWIGMTIWISIESHGMLEFCRNYNRPPHMRATCTEHICSTLFAMVIGIVYVFIYFSAIDSKTFYKHLFFYVICFLQNMASNLVWRFTAFPQLRNCCIINGIFIACMLSFFLGIVAMIIYYMIFHPSKRQRTSDASLQAI